MTRHDERTATPATPVATLSIVNLDCQDPPTDDFTPTEWPDTSSMNRYHLDLQVDDLARAESACQDLGPAIPEFQPGGERWRVLTRSCRSFVLPERQAASRVTFSTCAKRIGR